MVLKEGCCSPEIELFVISLWKDIEVLELKYCDTIGISKLLGLRWGLFLLSNVPSPVRML